jgi:PAS domain S-box-containing protein
MLKDDCKMVFDFLPGIYLVLKPDPPDFTIVDFNRARAEATLSDRSFIGLKLFEAFPDNKENPEATGVKNLTASLMTVLETRKKNIMPLQKYDIYNPETAVFEERFWLPQNIPVLDEAGNVKYIIHSVEDVTSNVLLSEKESQVRKELVNLHNDQKKILESIADGFISVDKNWIVLYWNKEAERIFQIKREEVLGNYLWDYIKEQRDNKLYECFTEAMQKNKPSSFEKYYATKDIWLQVNAYPSSSGLTAFLLDITDRKNAERELENNEKRFRALVENSTDGITVISREGVVLDVSYSGRKILGYEPEELVGQIREDLIHPDDWEKVINAFHHVANNASAIEVLEYRFLMSDGQYKWLEGTFHNLLHEPTINAIVLNYRDISERKKHQNEILASEEKYRYLFDNNPATIIIWTLDDLKIQEVNSTAVQLLGFSKDQFKRMTILDIRPPEERDRFLNHVLDLQNSEKIRNEGSWIYQNYRGQLFNMSLSFHRINYDGKQAILALGTNITDKVRLEQKIDQERKRKQKEITEAVLKAQENEREELGKELHDNISQILTTTRLFLDYVLSKKGDQDELISLARSHISNAIQEIRNLSRALMPPTLKEVSLKLSLEDLLGNINAFNSYKIHFNYSVDNEDELNTNLKLAVFRIIQEQLNNIIKHSKADMVLIDINKQHDSLNLRIKDNGVGFDSEKRTDGLGIRNIISRASLYKGRVSIDSQPGSGTELNVSFQL